MPRLTSFLDASDLDAPLTGTRLIEFERFVDSSVRGQDTLAIKLWNAAGIVVFADDAATVGAAAETHEIEEMADALVEALDQEGQLTFQKLRSAVEARLEGRFEGSIGWYFTTIKLEARGIVVRIGSGSPQRLQLQNHL